LERKWRSSIMPNEVKVFRVNGRMLISHDKLPEWRKFNLEILGVSEKDIKEKVYSLLGSRHKLRRKHIVIEEIVEVEREKVISKHIRDLISIEGWKA
jgi:large subunit ribosomal protein LX